MMEWLIGESSLTVVHLLSAIFEMPYNVVEADIMKSVKVKCRALTEYIQHIEQYSTYQSTYTHVHICSFLGSIHVMLLLTMDLYIYVIE